MTTPFPSSGTGDPVRSQRRLALQDVLGVAAVSGFVDAMTNGGPLTPARTTIAPGFIKSSSQRQRGLPGPYTPGTGPWDFGDLDPASPALVRMFLVAMQRYSVATVSGAHKRYRMSQEQGTLAPPALTVLNDPDTGWRYRHRDVRPSGWTISVASGQNARLVFPVVTGKHDFFAEPTQEAGTGSTLPQLRHSWSGNHVLDAVDKDLWIKVQSQDVTSAVIQVKVGAAAAYSATVPVTFGAWAYLTDEAGLVLGTQGEQIQIFWPSGATLADDDEFKFLKRRARWTPSFHTPRRISEVACRMYIDGEETFLDGGYTITQAIPGVNTLPSPGSAQALGTRRSGEVQYTWSVTRSLLDATLQAKLMAGAPVSLVMDARADALIGVTSTPFALRCIMPAGEAQGTFFDVAPGGGEPVEQIAFTAAEPDSSFSYLGRSRTVDFEIEIDTDVTV